MREIALMPKKYAQTDEGMFVPYASSDKLVPEAVRQFWEPPADERRDSNRNMPLMYHRVGAGPLDPMAVVHIIDVVQRWNPNFYIRAKYVSRALNERQDHYWFEPITAGKVLAEMAELAQEEWQERAHLTPITANIDYRGQFYLLANEPTTWQWFWKLRTGLQQKCLDIRALEAQGVNVKRVESPWTNIDTSPT